jgi:hypothetical protein
MALVSRTLVCHLAVRLFYFTFCLRVSGSLLWYSVHSFTTVSFAVDECAVVAEFYFSLLP